MPGWGSATIRLPDLIAGRVSGVFPMTLRLTRVPRGESGTRAGTTASAYATLPLSFACASADLSKGYSKSTSPFGLSLSCTGSLASATLLHHWTCRASSIAGIAILQSVALLDPHPHPPPPSPRAASALAHSVCYTLRCQLYTLDRPHYTSNLVVSAPSGHTTGDRASIKHQELAGDALERELNLSSQV